MFRSLSATLQNSARLFPTLLALSACFCLAGEPAAAQAPTPPQVARLVTAPARVQAAAARQVAAIGALTALAVPVGTAATRSLERRAFELLNVERAAAGEAPLVWDEGLNNAARLHSADMAGRDFFSHTGPDGMGVAERARALGISGWRALGENIAYNQGFEDPAAFAVERWMKSVKHRENALNREFTHAAVGVAVAPDGRVFFTQVFLVRGRV